MKVSYPVVLCRNGVEYAAIVCKASPRDEQPPPDPTVELTQRQRLGELRCDLAFFDPVIRGWSVAENVRYISLDELVPAEGDVYYETGAPDPAERKIAYDDMQDRLARAKPTELDQPARGLEAVAAGDGAAGLGRDVGGLGTGGIVDDERPATSAELAIEEDVNEAKLEGEGGPASAELVERQGRAHG